MRTTIQTSAAPNAIGPYSQAIFANGFLFASGQIAIDPATGDVVGGDVAAQTKQVMQNVKAVLAGADMGYEHIVKTTIFLLDMADFAAVNEVYGACFAKDSQEPNKANNASLPARSTVAVVGLPRGVRVEIEVVATKA